MTELEREGVDIFIFPQDETLFGRMYWRASDCARKWGVSWSTARRYMVRSGQAREVMLLRPGGGKMVRVVPAGMEPPDVPIGNPRMRDNSDFQRAAARCRWKKA